MEPRLNIYTQKLSLLRKSYMVALTPDTVSGVSATMWLTASSRCANPNPLTLSKRSVVFSLPIPRISWKSAHKFFNYFADKQKNRSKWYPRQLVADVIISHCWRNYHKYLKPWHLQFNGRPNQWLKYKFGGPGTLGPYCRLKRPLSTC